nr:Abi family protein [Anaerotalea alkaliphila]
MKSRGLIISNEDNAKKVLAKENYYNVINGYKKPFLKKDLSGNILIPEQYVENCRFEEIHSLHNFDRDMRMLLLGFLLKFETHFKTSCAYNFAEEYSEPYAYINVQNYSNEREDLTHVLNNIAALSNEINRNTNKHKAKSAYISHYVENHESVPLWVLVNSLTIGNMSYFYSAVDSKIKGKIARDFSSQYKNEYNTTEKIDIGEIAQIVKVVNLFRNVCAHEEVLYFFKLRKPIRADLFTKYFVGDRININKDTFNNSNLFTLICILKLVMPKIDYVDFIDKIDCLFKDYDEKFSAVKFSDIILLSGFNQTWKEDILKAI